MTSLPDFESFRADAVARGFDEVLERRWAPQAVTGIHTHPFSVEAVLVEGEMWLQQGPITVHLVPGSGFQLEANVPHSERYGPEGAMFYAARRREKREAA
ncbi:cupin domain-containing protein [Ramlibacter sp. PS4R-6]|uniref:cupin domain-containing protein n=1 Tax=Ramlibacter sp. PS4R-6 TaxID=3133438 RepID=UPI0030B390F3